MIYIRHSLLLILTLLLISCSDDSLEPSSTEIQLNAGNQAVASKGPAAEVIPSSPWKGEAKGYVVKDSPANSRVAFLVEIAKVRVRAETYNNTKNYYATSSATEDELAEWPDLLRVIISQQVIDDYAAIDTLVQQVRDVDIVNVLAALTSDDSIAAAVNNEYAARDAQNEQFRKAQAVAGQLEDVNERLFPTRKEYLYLASALLRLGGDYAAKGIGQNGVVRDLQNASMAYSSSLIAYDSRSRWISYCDKQRTVIDDFKKLLYDLGEKAFAQKVGVNLTVTATDFYDLAAQALATADLLPDTDEEICN